MQPTFDVILHISVYLDNFYGISNNTLEETIKASVLIKNFAYMTLNCISSSKNHIRNAAYSGMEITSSVRPKFFCENLIA